MVTNSPSGFTHYLFFNLKSVFNETTFHPPDSNRFTAPDFL